MRADLRLMTEEKQAIEKSMSSKVFLYEKSNQVKYAMRLIECSSVKVENFYDFSFFQETSVASLKASLETMQGSAASLNEELGSDLLSQLSVEDQREVDYLNDQIKNLTQQNKEALTERIRVKSKIRRLNFGSV